MPASTDRELDRDLDRLRDLAATLAAAWSARARTSTTVGVERAILRLFGVSGLDSRGRPLAGEVLDRYLAGAPNRLAGGIGLPFAMALVEYDLTPQQLALDVAAGMVDLGLEAELLVSADRRAAAEAEAGRLAAVAVERIDANRTARRELLDLLGDAPRPWVGTSVLETATAEALDEAGRLVRHGADLLRVEVPAGLELIDRLTAAGVPAPRWHPREGSRAAAAADLDPAIAPTGSQRGLAELRRGIDEGAAERGAYARLASEPPPLGGPEGAVVAAFERVDAVVADPLAEIVTSAVDPDRALVDHAFARRLHRRADTHLVIGPGPLAVAPDLAAGVPSDPPTRAGRALALQLLAALGAMADGIAPERLIVGALPAWLTEEPLPVARAVAEIELRRRLLPGAALVFDEPETSVGRAPAWPFLIAALVPPAPATAMLFRRPGGASFADTARSSRAAITVAGELSAALGPRTLDGPARTHAIAALAAATATLEQLSERGWRAVIGQPPGGDDRSRLGADAVVERSESFDPIADALARDPH